MKGLVLSFCCLCVPLAAALAQSPADGDRDRFTFKQVPEGVLRLDRQTGQVALCSKRGAGLACETAAEDRTALETEIGRLQNENAKLKRELADRGSGLPEGLRTEPATPKGDDLKSPGDADLERVMAFLDKLWRRLIALVQTLHKDREWDRNNTDDRPPERKQMNAGPSSPRCVNLNLKVR